MMNLVVNILFGHILEIIYTSFVYNSIKSKSCKSTYIIYAISYIVSAILICFSYNSIYLMYIYISVIFYIINAIYKKQWHQITNMLLMLNILLITSILTAIPIIFFGYNVMTLIITRIELILFMLVSNKISSFYKFWLNNWNRTLNNKIKSVSIRNFTLLTIYVSITLINIFLNELFLHIYNKII